MLAVNASPTASPLERLRAMVRAGGEYLDWKRRGGTGAPPHFVKQRTLREVAARHGLRTLVETGTYRGDMVAAMRPFFDRIVSIELGESLARAATARFAGDPRVTILEGDSARVLPRVLEELGGPALFWLDGHFSGGETARGPVDSPLVAEFEAILSSRERRHVVLIDDARLCDGKHGYPTLEALRALVAAHRPEWSVALRDDILRLAPSVTDAPRAGRGREAPARIRSSSNYYIS